MSGVNLPNAIEMQFKSIDVDGRFSEAMREIEIIFSVTMVTEIETSHVATEFRELLVTGSVMTLLSSEFLSPYEMQSLPSPQ